MISKFMVASFCVGVLFGIVVSSLVVRGLWNYLDSLKIKLVM
jgi:hypothetical protein